MFGNEEQRRTQQAAFNGVWRGLKWQGFKRSLNAKGLPDVRGLGGRCCAYGWLTDDAHLGQFGLVQDALRTLRSHGYDTSGVTIRSLLDSMFRAHDYGFTPHEMEDSLREIARYYHLTIPNS